MNDQLRDLEAIMLRATQDLERDYARSATCDERAEQLEQEAADLEAEARRVVADLDRQRDELVREHTPRIQDLERKLRAVPGVVLPPLESAAADGDETPTDEEVAPATARARRRR